MNNIKIGSVEAVFVILTALVVQTVLSLPKTLIENIKTSIIINVVYITIMALILVYIIYRLLKHFPGLDIIDISEILGGKTFKNIIGFIFIAYFIVNSSIFLRNFCECLRIIYYPSTDIFYIIIFFIFGMCLVNSLEFNASIRTNTFIMPAIIISIFFLFFANFRNFAPQRIFPILGDSFYNTFISGIGNIFSFSGIVFLYFLPPLLKEQKKFKAVAFSSVIVCAIYLLLTISVILFVSSFFMEKDDIMPLYTAATYIEFGPFFQRLESIFLLTWMIGFCCYLSIVQNFAVHIFKKITNIKNAKIMVYPFAGIMIAIALLPKNYAISKFYERNIFPFLVITIVFIMSICILFLANIKHKKKLSQNNEVIKNE